MDPLVVGIRLSYELEGTKYIAIGLLSVRKWKGAQIAMDEMEGEALNVSPQCGQRLTSSQ